MEKLNYEDRDKLKPSVRNFLDLMFSLDDNITINIALAMTPKTEDPELFLRRLYWTWMFLTDGDALINSFAGKAYFSGAYLKEIGEEE
jgi:hypothetical protein